MNSSSELKSGHSSSSDEDRIHALISAIHAPILLLSGEKISSSNTASHQLLGYDDLSGRRFSDLFPLNQPDGRSSLSIIEGLIRNITPANPQTAILTLHNMKGEGIPVEIILSKGDGFASSFLICTIKDLSLEYIQKKRTDALSIELEQKTVWYEAILDAIPFPISVTDPEMIWTYVNTAVEKFKHTTREKLVGKKCGNVAGINKLRKGITETFFEDHGMHFKIDVAYLEDRKGGKIGHVEIVQNISHLVNLQKRAERIVRENPIPMVIIDSKHHFGQANEAFISLTGYDPKDLSALSFKDLKVVTMNGFDLSDVFVNQKNRSGEAIFRFPSGEKEVALFAIALVDEEGNTSDVLLCLVDMTKERNADRKLQESIHELAGYLAKVAGRELKLDISCNDSDPLCEVKADLNDAISSIRNTLSEIFDQVQHLESSMQAIGEETVQISKASGDVAVTADQTSEKMKEQVIAVSDLLRSIEGLSASFEEIASTSQEVMSLTTNAAKSGESAVTLGEEASVKMEAVEEISRSAVGEIGELNEKILAISKIVRVIADIANQTNLLALNAAIEAARAGEAGRGFAVVAGEVKSLAGESRKATENIETVISEIITQSEKTSSLMQKAFEEIVTGIGSVSRTVDALHQIVGDVDNAAVGIGEINKANQDQLVEVERVSSGIGIISEITQENEEKMIGLSAIAEQTSASLGKVSAESSEVLEMSVRLRKAIEGFRLE